MNSYQDRLDKLNDSDREVWDSIDRPIQPLIWELNRIGLRTKFCCCGFNYDGEEEPKTHAKQPFVVLVDPRLTQSPLVINTFFELGRVAPSVGWEMCPYGNAEWHLHFIAGDGQFYRQTSTLDGIHNYETSLIRTQHPVRLLARSFPTFQEKFSIVDGNSEYAKITGGEWQVKPKKETFFDAKVKPYEL